MAPLLAIGEVLLICGVPIAVIGTGVALRRKFRADGDDDERDLKAKLAFHSGTCLIGLAVLAVLWLVAVMLMMKYW